jgi:hypothetical protein
MVRGVSGPCEGSKILTFLYGPRLVCSSLYISEARGGGIVRGSPLRSSPKFGCSILQSTYAQSFRARNVNNVASTMTFRFPVCNTERVACSPTSH